jgi:hypothetical protein
MGSLIDIMVVGIVLFCLIFTLIYSMMHNFVFDNKMMYVLAIIYVVFILSATAVQI